jgi:TPR repeat protein
MYQRGRGVAADPKLAADWYLRAAEEGHLMAQNNLASMYSRGEGVTQDHYAAARWYERAAEAGFAVSQYRLGQLYEEGLGVRRDRAAALEWYDRAAKQGFERADEARRRLQAEPVATAPTARAARSNQPAAAPTRETIRETQALLARMNFLSGTADGRFGPQTERAIRDFQKEAGLAVTGVPSSDLLDELKAVARTMAP